jgi:hypothetical protein
MADGQVGRMPAIVTMDTRRAEPTFRAHRRELSRPRLNFDHTLSDVNPLDLQTCQSQNGCIKYHPPMVTRPS